MKIRIFTIFLFISSVLCSFANDSQMINYDLKWKGVEKWHAGEHYSEVIVFEGASFDTDFLPIVQRKFAITDEFTYQFEIQDAVFIPVPKNEVGMLELSSNPIAEDVKIETHHLFEKSNKYIELFISPFVKKDDVFYKLESFILKADKVEIQPVQKIKKSNQYAANSVLAEGKFIKIRIKDSGVYKLTKADLQSMGISNPDNVRMFGYGGAMLNENFSQAIIDDLPEVAIYKSGDDIVFYAQGINSWKYNSIDKIYRHTLNPYSNYGYYFLTSDMQGDGKKIAPTQKENVPESATVYDINEFLDYQVHEKEERSLINSGKIFYGEIFKEKRKYSFTFNFPNVVKKSKSAKMYIDVAVSSSETTEFRMGLDEKEIQKLYVTSSSVNYLFARPSYKLSSYTPTKDDLIFDIEHYDASNASTGYLNYVEVNAFRELIMVGNAMTFQNNENLAKNAYNKFTLKNVNSDIQIWDITDLNDIKIIPADLVGNECEFTVSSTNERRFLAIYPNADFSKPEKEGDIANQNIHGHDLVDYVIITHPDFKSEAERLANAHKVKSNLRVGVFTTEDIYNEYSSGAPDATAYRKLMKMFFDRAQNESDRPKYLLLFGKGNFDSRRLLSGSSSAHSYVLAYQADNSTHETNSYVTDDYFGLLSNEVSATNLTVDMMDVGIGRIPVKSVGEAKNAVDKIIGYMENKNKGKWKNQLLFLADDGDGNQHMEQQDQIAVLLKNQHPSYQINKIYLDAFLPEVAANGKIFPMANNKFKNHLSSGVFMVHYSGHSGTMNWTAESLLTNNDIISLSNTNLPIWFSYSCNFSDYDRGRVSGGEDITIKAATGGIGVFASARVSYALNAIVLNENIAKYLFAKDENGEHYAIGDIIRMGKNDTRLGTGASGINKLSYLYFGDPALKLSYPTDYEVKTTKINGNANFNEETLTALSDVSIEGEICDDSGQKITDFNGEIHLAIFDKEQEITTLTSGFKYKDYPNIIYSGKVAVVNGEFKIDFMVPKDIKYNVDKGRINYYAFDAENNWEAQGYFEDIYVGGSNPNFVFDDEEGPEVLSIYLNHKDFVSGEKVNETPLFVAEIYDENGINTVGAGIGHDVLLVVDNDMSKTYILNEYLNLDLGTYKSGSLKFFIPELQDGKHTLRFRVSDLLNNTTTKTLDFEVVKGLEMSIFAVKNYPNPATPYTGTTFEIQHDRPETLLSVQVDIYDISGRKIYSFVQSTMDKIYWDLSSSEGFKVSNGMYIYRVTINTSDGNSVSKSNKIIIKGQ